MKIKDVIVENISFEDAIQKGDSFDIELGDLVIETGVVGFTDDGVILEADAKTMALLGISGALFESVALDEVSLGDYHKKASMNKALSQMSAAFAPSPEERAKNYNIAGRRERGLARAKTRYDKAAATAAATRKAEYEKGIRDKYAGVDLDAEIAKLKPAIERAYHDYQYGASNTYSAAGDEYNRLKAKVQELERAKEVLKQGVAEGAEFGSHGAEQLALEVFKQNPNLSTGGRADELQDAGFVILAKKYGKKRANYYFNYDEDFPSDFVSSYDWLQKNGIPEDLAEGQTKKQMIVDAERMELAAFVDKYGDEDWIKEFWNSVNDLDEAKYQGREVPLGKPMQGDVKKSKVYVKGPKGNVVKVNFGDKKMKIKKSNPKRRKSFRARHNCANPGPRWKARYWSCRAW